MENAFKKDNEEKEQSLSGNLSDDLNDLKKHLCKYGVPLETQVQNCVDTIIVIHKQKEGFLDVIGFLSDLHNRNLQQIEFSPN